MMRLWYSIAKGALVGAFCVAALCCGQKWLGASPVYGLRLVLGFEEMDDVEPTPVRGPRSLGFLPEPEPEPEPPVRQPAIRQPVERPVAEPAPTPRIQPTPEYHQPPIDVPSPSAPPASTEWVASPSPQPWQPRTHAIRRAPVVPMPEKDRYWFGGEYLMWWIRDSQTPPLVTTSPQASLGIIGQPGTVVLHGYDLDNELRSGGRFQAGAWLDPHQRFGVEAGFLFLGDRTNHFGVGSSGDPLYARPFLNAATGREDAEQIASLGLGAALPVAGRIDVSNSSRLWGAELNALTRLCRPCGPEIRLLAGFRFLKLDEDLFITEDLRVATNSPEFAGARIRLSDEFATENEFYGGQVGGRVRFGTGPLTLDLLAKVGLGVTHQTAVIGGSTQINEPGQVARQYPGALLSQPTNLGRYNRDRFSVVPELGVTGGWWVTDHLRATVGYTFLFWSGVARPGNQIDRVVNETGIPPGALRGPARPAFAFQDTEFWAHGLSFGLEFSY